MKNIKLFTFSILFTCSVFSQNNIWTLEECVQHALENNISILQAKNSQKKQIIK